MSVAIVSYDSNFLDKVPKEEGVEVYSDTLMTIIIFHDFL